MPQIIREYFTKEEQLAVEAGDLVLGLWAARREASADCNLVRAIRLDEVTARAITRYNRRRDALAEVIAA